MSDISNAYRQSIEKAPEVGAYVRKTERVGFEPTEQASLLGY